MIIKHHKKYLERLANIYVDKFLKDGEDKALSWADRLLTASDMQALAPYARREFTRRGVKSQ